jgi:selenocysteine lyase/cysteine desulfurase
VTSYKRLFSRALTARPDRLHMAAHSHHLWPDATRAAQLQAWEDAAVLADEKWDKVLGEVLPEARANVARELNLPAPDTIAFAPNTHELLKRIVSALPVRPTRVLTTDAEFHAFRRQSARWVEAGEMALKAVPAEPADTFEDRFLTAAEKGGYDLIFVSHVAFKTGRVFRRAFELADLARPEGPWIVIDAYHGFMALPTDLSAVADRVFYLAGGYKYAMAGEGAAFLHAPPGYGSRPIDTGWYAEFGELSGPPGGVGYPQDGSRFFGSTFDPSGLYRLNAVFDLLRAEGLDTAAVSEHVRRLRVRLAAHVADGRAGRLAEAALLVPPGPEPQARFLAFRHPKAGDWRAGLAAAGALADRRDDVLRAGLGLYHDPEDIDAFAEICARTL